MDTSVVTEALTGASSSGSFLSELLYKGGIGLLVEQGKLSFSFELILVLLWGVVSYLLGSINFAVVISRLRFHDDIRNHGSGNAGATNMIRTYGKSAGVMTFVGDLLKAILSVMAARLLFGDGFAYFAGLCCALGHAFPCFYHFKGGKCVAVTAAMALVLEPLAFLILLVIFLLMAGFTKYISLASISAALFYPLVLYNIMKSRFGSGDLRILFVLVQCLLVVYLHRENIKRLLEGKESKFQWKKKSDGKNRAEK